MKKKIFSKFLKKFQKKFAPVSVSLGQRAPAYRQLTSAAVRDSI
jgi:hypothetical protein